MSENLKSRISNSINNTYKDVFSVYVYSIFKTATALTHVHTNEASHGSEQYILQEIYKMYFGLTFSVKHENNTAMCYPSMTDSMHLIMNLLLFILCYDESLF